MVPCIEMYSDSNNYGYKWKAIFIILFGVFIVYIVGKLGMKNVLKNHFISHKDNLVES